MLPTCLLPNSGTDPRQSIAEIMHSPADGTNSGKFLEVWPRLRHADTTKRPVCRTDSTVYLGEVCVCGYTLN